MIAPPPARAVYYNAVVLSNSSFPGAQGFALNDNNQVTGYYYDHIGSGHYQQPFVYNFSTNTFSALPGFSNTSNYVPTGINDSGLIVGSDGTTNKGFVDNAGAITEVSPLAGSTLTFSGVNSNGLAVGTSTTATTGVTRAVVYNSTSHVLTDVGSGFSGPVSAGFSNSGYGINASGQVEGLGVDTGGSSTAANANAIAQPFIATPTGSGNFSYKNVGNVIDPSDSSTYTQYVGGIDAQGNLVGTVATINNSSGYIYTAGTSTVATPTAYNPSTAGVIAEVNGTPAVSGIYYPLVADSSGAYTHGQGFPPYLYTNGTLSDLYNFAPGGVTLGNPLAINSNGSILFSGNSATAGAVTVLLTIVTTQVVYTGASSNSWDTTSANFSPANYADGDLVVFDDSATGSTSITIPNTVSPQSVTFNNSSKSYVLSGAGIAGAGNYLNLTGSGRVTLNNVNTYTGPTNVSAGTLVIGSSGQIASSAITVSAGALLNVQSSTGLAASQTQPPSLALSVGGTVLLQNYGSGTPSVLGVSNLSIAGSTNNWTGKLDLANNDLVAYRGGSLSQITNQVKSGYAGGTWQGNGITSSAAAADTTHLTALGVIQDTVDGVTTNGTQLYTTFHGVSVYSNYVLVGYTFYGDANLDGQVDGSDYARIDNAVLNNQNSSNTQLTGWYNGDFNYDGVINGSDYTLIDNAFNTQGANLGGGQNPNAGNFVEIAAQIASGIDAVPEPATLSLLGVAVAGMLGRRRHQPCGRVKSSS